MSPTMTRSVDIAHCRTCLIGNAGNKKIKKNTPIFYRGPPYTPPVAAPPYPFLARVFFTPLFGQFCGVKKKEKKKSIC